MADYSDLSKISAFDENILQFEVEFLNEVNIQELEKLKLVSAINVLSDKSFSVMATSDIRSEIFDFAVKTNNKILTMKAVERSMEDVFRELTI